LNIEKKKDIHREEDWRLKRLTHTKPRRTQRKTIL